MKHVSAVVLLSFFVCACGAGEPQNNAVRENAQLHLWPASKTTPEAEELINDGIREIDWSHGQEAFEHFRRASALDTTSAIAEMYAGLAAAYASLSTQVIYTHLDRARQLASHATPFEQLLIDGMYKSFHGDNAGALDPATKMTVMEPNNPRSWANLAVVDSLLGETAKSREHLQKAIEVAPDYAPAYLELSASYAASPPIDLTKAEQLARKGVSLEPDEALSYDALGDALRAQGKLAEAAQAYTKQAQLAPTEPDGLIQRGHVNAFLGHYPEARADYDAASVVSKNARQGALAMYRAYVAGFEGKPRQQFDELEAMYKGMGASPFDGSNEVQQTIAQAQIVTAVHEHASDEMKIAAANYRDAYTRVAESVKSPDVERAARAAVPFTKALEALSINDFTAASRFANEFITISAPGHDIRDARLGHELFGHIALAQKNYAESASQFEQANPNLPEVWYYHALALEGAGRAAEAQQIYKAIANYYFNAPGVSLFRAEVQAKLKKAA
jgi:tetratricopeptide (TPR) repeat protein